ncbi:alcohol dehydrogenase [Neomicrococcus aestuarii]|uniref:Alcohol dehydrogenase n=1 Tax=Neomicrococcus aestuarii TaxID=556325 RepID=A0A7W8TW33_9MICC|nr:alcohol dehydrogenase catalytic domain-containing protein [Neomicrococcus aestuarii]MBB5512581.1 alcohol dehydrogenase [Neomicrococcus aestuarii]
MTTIRGAVLNQIGAQAPYAQSRPITIDTLELTAPEQGQALIRIEAAGLCHSDLSVVNGSRPRPTPMLLGHEAAGIVEEIGEGVENIAVGQRVVLTFLPRCGECPECATNGKLPCRNGSQANSAGTLMDGSTHLTRETTGHAEHGGHAEQVAHHLGVSGFSTYAVIDARSAVPVHDDVAPDIAAVLGCAVLTGGGALLNAAGLKSHEVAKDSRVAIVGLGGVGMAGLLTALALECKEVIAIDAQESKLELAKAWGAHATYTPAEAIERKVSCDVVLEAVGHPRAFETAFAILGLGGTLVTVGLPAPGATAEIEPLQLTAKAQQIVGSYLGSAVPARDIPIFEQLWRDGKLPLEKLVTQEIELENINEAMDALASGKVLRQIIRFP